eukprot:TRINITY_DN407_c0_g1_i3.p1 TRINITY_DN407_c0_g1~~TRINITY_DN407_c0_g1_i3.p1  ORF type:complete len:127 (-),score=26.20 TRINITY_DN407_c0_g1_i3:319-699(-)
MTWVCFLKNLPESVVLSHFRVLLLTMSLHENEEDKRKVLDTLKIMKRGMDDLGVFLEELANQAECLDAAQKGAHTTHDTRHTLDHATPFSFPLSRSSNVQLTPFLWIFHSLQRSVKCLTIGTLYSN